MRKVELNVAKDLAEMGELDKAYELTDKWLNKDPNDTDFLTLLCYIMQKSHKLPVAYHLAKTLTAKLPREPSAWINLGLACNELWQEKESERAYKRALEYSRTEESRSMALINMTALLIDTGRFKEAEGYAREALKINKHNEKATANLGFCQLARRQWNPGWKNYHKSLGHTDWREKTQYNDEPEWDGKSKGKVVLYGEQGLGDELSFASMVPDALAHADIVLDVDYRLKNLFERSFPDAKVYGTRGQKNFRWDKEDTEPDYSLALGQCGEFYRNTDKSFPGTPYLQADLDRITMWKALWATKKKPIIGVAWRGGITRTGAKYRQWDLEQLLPIFQSVDAHWVSLQYKPAGKEIAKFKKKHPEIDLVEYPHATLTNDYDDTAGLVASLDMVICMQTAVTHLAGAMGIPVWTFVPNNSQWRYGTSDRKDFVWAKSVRLIRQQKRGEWKADIKQAAEELSVNFPRVSKRTTKAA